MAENMIITVDDGSRRVPIQNMDGEEIGSFRFHPTDVSILHRYGDMVEEFNRITEPLEAVEDAESPDGAEALKEAEARMRAAVDKLFNSDGAAAAFFGNMNPFSPVEGAFYAQRVLESVGAFIGAQFDAEVAKFEAHTAKYLKDAAKPSNRAQRRATK